MKTCSRCKEAKAVDNFRKFNRAPDGLSYWCRACFNDWEAENKERRLARQKTPEYRATRKKWRETSQYYENNKAYWQKWYQDNKPRVRAGMDQWRAANLDKWNGYGRKRRAVKLSNGVEPYSLREVWDRDSGICQLCGESIDRSIKWPHVMSLAVDHIIPISKGGPDTLQNVQLSHLKCNASKADKIYA